MQQVLPNQPGQSEVIDKPKSEAPKGKKEGKASEGGQLSIVVILHLPIMLWDGLGK